MNAARVVASMALCAGSIARAQQANPNPMDSIRKLPSYRPAHDSIPLLTHQRIASLITDHRMRVRWDGYLSRSALVRMKDSTTMASELRSAGKSGMTRAPYAHDFTFDESKPVSWFSSDSVRRIAEAVLSFQAPNGGWSKHVDYSQHARRPGESYYAESAEWDWISTIDNNATTAEIRFLGRVNAARTDARDQRAIIRGVEYLLASQYPNGCFPQVFPLEGSYHDDATFNDDAIVNVLRLLRDVSEGRFSFVPPAEQGFARTALVSGIDCILAAQVRVNGKLTAWGQQHDPLTLEPTSARSYELTSLSAQESASIVDFLMSVPQPSERVVRSVQAAVAWLKPLAFRGYSYAKYEFKPSSDAPPLWGRLYEIGTNRVIMANRDGKKLYDWNQLTDRRSGYAWYTTRPAATLAAYEKWSKAHP